MTDEAELHLVQQLIARERLSLDVCARGRTCFLSHVGAVTKLVPGPWIGHRDLIYALALANLTPAQRTALARSVLVDHGREFGVGRLALSALPSGLPLGGCALRLHPRGGGPVCLYTWALGEHAGTAACEWLLLRAEPGMPIDAKYLEDRVRLIAGLHLVRHPGGHHVHLDDPVGVAAHVLPFLQAP